MLEGLRGMQELVEIEAGVAAGMEVQLNGFAVQVFLLFCREEPRPGWPRTTSNRK